MKKCTSLFLALLMIVSLLAACDFDVASDAEEIEWINIRLGHLLPEPQSNLMKIVSNDDETLLVYVHKISQNQYLEYLRWCEQEKGFSIDAETKGSSFCAYNEAGYKLTLSYYDYSGEMHITLTASKDFGNLTWPTSEMAQMLPTPDSNVGEVQKDDEKMFSAYVGDVSFDAYNAYVKACEDKGFTVDANKSDKSFSAKNTDGYRLSVKYQGNSVIFISLDEPEFDVSVEVECVENWIFSKYDVDVYIDGVLEGTIPHGDNATYSLVLTKGMHTITFESAEDDTLDGDVQMEISQNEIFKFKISCSSFGIDVETIQGTTSDATDKPNDSQGGETTVPSISIITLTMDDDDFKGMNQKEAEQKFRQMGFTKFKYRTVDTETESQADTISYIEITEWIFGDSDFKKGDKFDVDSAVTFFTYKYEAPAAPSPVFYSTNDYETAKKGNTGIFSYKNKSGSYDIYWIIDFNEGFVYWFTEGSGENVCDKVKIVSGDLNNKVTITWCDGGDQWSWYLHFKYMNHPETLIVNDHNGFATEFEPTDLDDALQIRNTKSIKEYLTETDPNAKALAAAIEYRDSNPDIILSIYDLWDYLEGLGYDDEAITYALDNAEGFDVGAAMYDYEKIIMFHNQGRSRTAIINYYLDILSYEDAEYLVDECLAGRKLTYEWTEDGLMLVDHTAGNNPTDAPKKFRITWSAQLVDSNQVGDNWSKSFEVNDTKFSSGQTITVEPGSQFTIRLTIQENDANPDTGYYFERIAYSEELCRNGYSISETLYVRENGGRYSGNRAEWNITISVTPI